MRKNTTKKRNLLSWKTKAIKSWVTNQVSMKKEDSSLFVDKM